MNLISKIFRFFSSWTGTVIVVLFVIFFIAQAFVIPSGSMKGSLLPGDFLFVKKYTYGIPTPHIPWVEWQVLPDSDGDGHLFEGRRPERGEIVVFREPQNPKIHFVKRLFAVGGDEVIFDLENFYLRPHEGDDFIDKNFNPADIVLFNGEKYVKEPLKFIGINYDLDSRNAMLHNVEAAFYTGNFAMKPLMISGLDKSYEIKGVKFNAFYIKVPHDEYFMLGDNRNNSADSRFWGCVPYKLIVGTPWFSYFSWTVPDKPKHPNPIKDRKIRWDRIARFVDTLQNDPNLVLKKEDK